jgi:hypothetical protein
MRHGMSLAATIKNSGGRIRRRGKVNDSLMAEAARPCATFGGRRAVDMLVGEQLPRIC